METPPTEPRRGWRTTEFWLNILAMIVSAIFMSGIPVEGIWGQIIGVIAFALTSMGYSISRGLAKMR